MKKLYTKCLTVCVVLMFVFTATTSHAQCPSGSTPGGVAYDTTIITQSGFNTIQLKFPQMDPEVGMVNCVRLCIAITGVVDSVSVENNSASPQTADIYYARTDMLMGPGLAMPLFNTINHHYGPYALSATDGIIGSGPDFHAISNDTVLKAQTICHTINDPIELSQFYGYDSVTYTYNISALTSAVCTGGNYNSSISTSAFVNFRFEYCLCSITLLPHEAKEFFAKKIASNKAELTWSGYDDPAKNYSYFVEVSRDGQAFYTEAELQKAASNDYRYKYVYTSWSNPGVRFFRIKQVFDDGFTRYSEIRSVDLASSKLPKFLIYPNPSNGIVGIKFDNNGGGQMRAEVFNSSGQRVARKEMLINGAVYWQIANLPGGMYWLKLTDVKTLETSVNQLFIK